MKWLANLSINKKLSLYFSLLIVLGLTTYGLITLANVQLRTSGGSIEIARRNQNLSFQMGFLASNLAKGERSLSGELQLSMKEFDRYLMLLKDGGQVQVREELFTLEPTPQEVLPELEKVEAQWHTYKVALEDLLSLNPDQQPERVEKAASVIRQATPMLYAAAKLYGNRYLDQYVNHYSFLQLLIFLMFALNLLVVVLGIVSFRHFISRPIKSLIKALEGVDKGNLSFELSLPYQDEMGQLAERFEQVKEHIEDSTAFALQVGDGRFDVPYQAKGEEDKLALSLLSMRDNLQKVALEDRRRNWANEGMARFSDLLRQQYDSVEVMADTLLTNLTKYVDANQGSFFQLLRTDDNKAGTELNLIACYAYNRKKFLKQTLLVGEGLVGQAVQERDTLYLSDIPESYVKIKSGLGQANPRNILVVPLMVNEEVYGVLELASFHEFESYKVAFIKNLSESIASTLANTYNADKTRKLLEQSQQMTRMMQEQEEEMRQNMEELQATQEEMDRKNSELEESSNRFSQLAASVEGMLYQFELRPDGTTGFSYASQGSLKLLGYSPQELMSAPDAFKLFKVTPEDLPAFQQTFQDSAQKQSEFQWKGRIYDRSGDLRWVHMRSKPAKKKTGGLVWHGLAMDISEEKEKEAAFLDMMESMGSSEGNLQQTVAELEQLQQELAAKQTEVEALTQEMEVLRRENIEKAASQVPVGTEGQNN